jgi:hypothetical protein
MKARSMLVVPFRASGSDSQGRPRAIVVLLIAEQDKTTRYV